MHEASLYPQNCFLTLTYDDENLPPDQSLNYSHVQLFLKRLRFHFRTKTIRFYMCGEYGTETKRPHYHLCLFNVSFPDHKLYKKSDTHHYLYHSPTVTKLWPYGHHTIGELNRQTAAYTARYIIQKITGPGSDEHYGGRTPEFNRMSLRPGIGASWFEKFSPDILTHDYLIVDGTKTPVPDYYNTLHKRKDPDTYEDTNQKRQIKAWTRQDDQTPERLHVKNVVTDARIKTLKRKL